MLHIQGRGFFHLGSLVYISVQSPGGIFLSFLKQKKCTEANHSQNQKQNVEVKWKSDDISMWYVIVKTKNTCNWIVWQPHHSAPFKLPIQVRNENQIQNCILCPTFWILVHVSLYMYIYILKFFLCSRQTYQLQCLVSETVVYIIEGHQIISQHHVLGNGSIVEWGNRRL